MGDFRGQSTNGGESLGAPQGFLPFFSLGDIPEKANGGHLAFMARESETSMHGDGYPVFAEHLDLVSLVQGLSSLSELVTFHALLQIFWMNQVSPALIQQLNGLIASDCGKGIIGITKSCLNSLMVLEDEYPQLSFVGRIFDGPLPAGEFLHLEFQLSRFGDVLEVAQFADGTIFQLDGDTSYLENFFCFRQVIFL